MGIFQGSTKWTAPLLILSIVLLCSYSQLTYGELRLETCLSDPEICHGKTLGIGSDAKAGVVQSDRFELIKGSDTITVVGSVKGLTTNDSIELTGIFHRDGYLELEAIHVRKLRGSKIIVSVLPVFLVGWMLWRQYRFDFQRKLFVER